MEGVDVAEWGHDRVRPVYSHGGHAPFSLAGGIKEWRRCGDGVSEYLRYCNTHRYRPLPRLTSLYTSLNEMIRAPSWQTGRL